MNELPPNQLKCLNAMKKVLEDCDRNRYIPFAPIMKLSNLSRKDVRRNIRALARKGFAEYGNGLCDEDGGFRGAGYKVTEKGWSA